MRVAALQMFATPFAQEANLARAEHLVAQAAHEGTQLAVLPELFNTGYVYTERNFEAAEPLDGPTATWLRDKAKAHGLYLAGSLLRSETLSGKREIYNTLLLVGPEGDEHVYDKAHPFLWEACYFRAGSEPVIAETALGRIGLLICWDIAHYEPAASYRGQVDLLVHVSSPARFHRAVINFPAGRKLYLAQLSPPLLKRRSEIDEWYGGEVGRWAWWLGAPVVHSVMAGRFVSALPFPRLSLFAASLANPRFYRHLRDAPQATLRASFWGSSAVYDANGQRLAQVEAETGIALADLSASSQAVSSASSLNNQYLIPNIPAAYTLLDRLLAPLARRYYLRHR